MKPTVLILLATATLPLAACASTSDNSLASADTTSAAGVTNAGYAPADATIGAPVNGIPGAVWADRDSDSRVDGYVLNGQYYAGVPSGYQSAAAPADCAAIASSASIPAGTTAGTTVSGVAGAVWTDVNSDGCVDGYLREGQYYQGAPFQSGPAIQPAGYRPGERG